MTEEELKTKYCCRCVNSDEKFNCIAKQEAPFDSFICDNGEMFEYYEKEMNEQYEREMNEQYEREMRKEYEEYTNGYKAELRKEYEREMRGY